MSDIEKWFSFMREDLDRAQNNFEAGNYPALHYFLGRITGNILVIRDKLSDDKRESSESSKD